MEYKIIMLIQNCAAIILAAGKGTRMKSKLAKTLNPIAGKAMIGHVIDAVAPLNPSLNVVVIADGMGDVAASVAPIATAIQSGQLGTADAVKAARDVMADFTTNSIDGTIFILYGDSPFITTATLKKMLTARAEGFTTISLGFNTDDPSGYGRLIMDNNGDLDAIIEHKECDAAQLKINLCNSGFMAIDGKYLFKMLDKITNDNVKGEFYLTDIIAITKDLGHRAGVIIADEGELMGVDSKADLAKAEKKWQDRKRQQVMGSGVTMLAPETVYFSHDTKVAADVIIEQNVVFGVGVTVDAGAVIRAFSHLEGAVVKSNAIIGPYARLRHGAVIGNGSKIGNFVEVKNSTLGDGAKVNHLSYIGDAEIGAAANIGAGTITCNYDGFLKSKTIIGKGAFIGSNSALIAPIEIGDGAIIAAGSVISKNVDQDAIAITRSEQKQRLNAAIKFKKIKALQKAKLTK